ncbi:hypothetical protein E3N88_43754 [Mikania micrantha]|uniref:WRKY domain-containing protein n=1 Tax=Mikania micrantha TaxID=192012 RepID=A0A5N6LE10_9ASTR|nr:hypothetical protein E3N88_43754 [Mikania micrantha]
MAVDLMNDYRNNRLHPTMEPNSVQEAAVAGLQSLENLVGILSSQSYQTNTTSSSSSSPPAGATDSVDYIAVADVAVNKFKKFISLLDRNRTGHARFRRGPVSVSNPYQKSAPVVTPASINHHTHQTADPSVGVALDKVYSPAPIQQRLPPPPQTTLQHSLVKSGSFDRKDFPANTINFAAASQANSFYIVVDRRYRQFTTVNVFWVSDHQSVTGFPPVNRIFRRLRSNENATPSEILTPNVLILQAAAIVQRKGNRGCEEVVRVPAISMKMADIPPDDYSWRKYGQKPIKGSPHPRR